jgi:DNA-binding YbaB/EbfC family protein
MSETTTFQDLIARAQQVRQRLVLAQQDLAGAAVTGTAGGGLVAVTMRGDGTVSRVVIDQAAVDDGDAESLSALILTAITKATDSVRSLTSRRMEAVSGDLRGSLTGDGH